MKHAWVSLADLASALGKSHEEMSELIEALYELGFPKPWAETNGFPVGHVLDWVVRQQEMNLELTLLLKEKIAT